MINISTDEAVTPFDTWSIYTALCLHFRKNSKYDAFVYNFKGPRCKRETFMNHRNRYCFEKIARAYPNKNKVIEYFLANILEGNDWVNSMTNDAYIRWQGRVQSINYDFNKTMSRYANDGIPFDNLFIPKDDHNISMPIIYKEYTLGLVPLETLVVLDILVGFTSSINKFVSDPLEIVDSINYYITCYKPFIKSKIDTQKAKQNVIKLYTHVNN